jgi:hypothetical protein
MYIKSLLPESPLFGMYYRGVCLKHRLLTLTDIKYVIHYEYVVQGERV